MCGTDANHRPIKYNLNASVERGYMHSSITVPRKFEKIISFKWINGLIVRMAVRWLPPYLSSRVWLAFLDCNSHGRAECDALALEMLMMRHDRPVDYGHDC